MFDYTIPGQAPGAYYAEHRPEFWKLSTTGKVDHKRNVSLQLLKFLLGLILLELVYWLFYY
jgi:hypothetical protein